MQTHAGWSFMVEWCVIAAFFSGRKHEISWGDGEEDVGYVRHEIISLPEVSVWGCVGEGMD